MYQERVKLIVDPAGEERLVRFLSQLPDFITGIQADRGRIAYAFQARMGNALLEKIEDDFIRKASGAAGEDGTTWKRLHPSTIANRTATRAELKQAGVSEGRYYKSTRGLLTETENREWKRVFVKTLYRLMARYGLSEREAKARAGPIAWSVLKGRGAPTKIARLGNRVVQILRDTGQLLGYFKPSPQPEREPPGDVLTIRPGRIIVEVADERKKWHHKGTARGLPARPFWPVNGLPPPYWHRMLDSGLRGLLRALALVLTGGRF